MFFYTRHILHFCGILTCVFVITKRCQNDALKYYLHFPTNATSWSQATDEVYDLARPSRGFLDEYDDAKVEAVDFATLTTMIR